MKIKSVIAAICLFAATSAAHAQQQGQPMTPEQREKQMYENIQKQVDDMASSLDLEDWQIFYADSILTTDYGILFKEFETLGRNRVSDTDIYVRIQDECAERIYNAFHAVLDEKQWAKYLKMGAARDKRARDKRAAKRQKQS